MATLILIGASLSIVFSVIGLYRRRSRARRITSGYTMELVFASIQLGATLAAGVFPIVWLLLSVARNGGPIEQNLPPGVHQDFLLGILLVGGAATLIYTVFNYLRNL